MIKSTLKELANNSELLNSKNWFYNRMQLLSIVKSTKIPFTMVVKGSTGPQRFSASDSGIEILKGKVK